jgi:hypothetical protein
LILPAQLNGAYTSKWKLFSLFSVAMLASGAMGYFFASASKNYEIGVSASVSLVERTLVRDAIARGDLSKAIELSDIAMYGDLVRVNLADTRSSKSRPESEQRQRERAFIMAKQSWLRRPIERIDTPSLGIIIRIVDEECRAFGAACPEGTIEVKGSAVAR